MRKSNIDSNLHFAKMIPQKEGVLCMLGGIYSDERCLLCGRPFKDDGKKGLFCPDHPQCKATKFKVKFKGICKRFDNYDNAHQVLEGFRFKFREGSFDPRDYRKEQPLGFQNLALKWLDYKKDLKSWKKIKYHINIAINLFGNRNIKAIDYAELEDFFLQLAPHLSDKTRYNIRTSLHTFWVWLKKREKIPMPEFPEIDFTLSWRGLVDKETQQVILNEIYRISYHINPKIYIGVLWLATYPSIRPIELLNIKQGDFIFSPPAVNIKYNKEGKPKIVPLLEEDIELVKSFPSALPHLYFFRHVAGISGVKAGQRFGDKYLYKWWKKACNNLGVEGVDLYGGTKHSTVTALTESFSPEQIKNSSMITTNKAFERYYRINAEDVRKVYAKAREADPNMTPDLGQREKGNLLKFKE